MLIKKRDLRPRLDLFAQLQAYNVNPENKDKKIFPYEVLRNIAFLEPLSMKLNSEEDFIRQSVSDGNMYVYPNTYITKESSALGFIKTEEYKLKEGEVESNIPPSKFEEYIKKYAELMNEDIEIQIFKIQSDKVALAVENEFITAESVVQLSYLGYIADN